MNHSRLLRAIAEDTAEWMERAKCRAMDPNDFHRPKGDVEGAMNAVAVCHACPVREPCLERALNFPASSAQGIWAGTSERERDRLRLRRRMGAS